MHKAIKKKSADYAALITINDLDQGLKDYADKSASPIIIQMKDYAICVIHKSNKICA